VRRGQVTGRRDKTRNVYSNVLSIGNYKFFYRRPLRTYDMSARITTYIAFLSLSLSLSFFYYSTIITSLERARDQYTTARRTPRRRRRAHERTYVHTHTLRK